MTHWLNICILLTASARHMYRSYSLTDRLQQIKLYYNNLYIVTNGLYMKFHANMKYACIHTHKIHNKAHNPH